MLVGGRPLEAVRPWVLAPVCVRFLLRELLELPAAFPLKLRVVREIMGGGDITPAGLDAPDPIVYFQLEGGVSS